MQRVHRKMDLMSDLSGIMLVDERGGSVLTAKVSGGGGAPLRDHHGNIITDLRRRQVSVLAG